MLPATRSSHSTSCGCQARQCMLPTHSTHHNNQAVPRCLCAASTTPKLHQRQNHAPTTQPCTIGATTAPHISSMHGTCAQDNHVRLAASDPSHVGTTHPAIVLHGASGIAACTRAAECTPTLHGMPTIPNTPTQTMHVHWRNNWHSYEVHTHVPPQHPHVTLTQCPTTHNSLAAEGYLHPGCAGRSPYGCCNQQSAKKSYKQLSRLLPKQSPLQWLRTHMTHGVLRKRWVRPHSWTASAVDCFARSGSAQHLSIPQPIRSRVRAAAACGVQRHTASLRLAASLAYPWRTFCVVKLHTNSQGRRMFQCTKGQTLCMFHEPGTKSRPHSHLLSR